MTTRRKAIIMRIFMSLAATMLVAGCATNPSFAPQGSTNTATIVGQSISQSLLSLEWKNFAVEAVDGKRIKHGFMANPFNTIVTVEGGPHRLVVSGAFNDGFGGPGPREAYIVLPVEIQAGKSYRLNGEVRENLLVTWLENPGTGEKLSAEASQPYTARRSGATVPIFIPRR